jgi:murein DD-endopeptidase MepM/ murein hydrolase activator NlpD
MLGMAVASPAAPAQDRPAGLGPVQQLLDALPLARKALTTPARPGAVFPVKGPARFGEGGGRFRASRGGRRHEGQDVFAPAGTPVLAARDGIVLEKGDDGGRGNYLAIFAPAVRQTDLYLHMRRPSRLEPGDRVRAGRRIGSVGCTGSCRGDHLHFEVRRGRGTQGKPLDPLPLLERWRD